MLFSRHVSLVFFVFAFFISLFVTSFLLAFLLLLVVFLPLFLSLVLQTGVIGRRICFSIFALYICGSFVCYFLFLCFLACLFAAFRFVSHVGTFCCFLFCFVFLSFIAGRSGSIAYLLRLKAIYLFVALFAFLSGSHIVFLFFTLHFPFFCRVFICGLVCLFPLSPLHPPPPFFLPGQENPTCSVPALSGCEGLWPYDYGHA